MRKTRGIKSRLGIERASCFGVLVALYAFSTAFDFLAIAKGVSLARITGIALLLSVFFNMRKTTLPKDKRTGLTWFALIFAVVPLMFMVNPADGVMSCLSYVINLLIVIVVLGKGLSEDDCRLCEYSLVLSALALCVLMFFSSGTVGHEWATERVVVNIAGSQQDANEFCGYLLFAIAFCSFRMIGRRSWLLCVVVLLCFYSILLTGSRGGLLSGLAALFFSVVFGLKGSKRKLSYAVILAVAMAVLVINLDSVLSLLSSSVAARFSMASISSGTTSYRMQAWVEVLGAFATQDPLRQLFGSGFGATTGVTFNGLVAHNSYIEILFDCGICGFICFVGIAVTALFRARKAENDSLVSGIVSFLVFFVSLSAFSFKTYWVLVALSFVAEARQRGGKSEDEIEH